MRERIMDKLQVQPASLDIWDKKYRLKNMTGQPVDESVEDTYRRVSHALAEVEIPEKREYWREKFLWALQNGAIPAGRIISNAGSQDHKPATSTINCTVSGTIEDSIEGILKSVYESGLTLKAGCGIGYEFSTLRPKGAFVSGVGASTSGPLSFMEIFDSMCRTISSAGGRRGAQMSTFDISHPDVIDFIKAKQTAGRFRMFNLSCLITHDFMDAVKKDQEWSLSFPASRHEWEDPSLHQPGNLVWRHWPVTEGYRTNAYGEVACRVWRRLPARQLWDLILSSTYDYAEPGFVLIDRVNEKNNNWFCEEIRTANPCGEQPLPPHGTCLLGSINLTLFVRDPFMGRARFDWERFETVVRIFTRMMDNVVEMHGLPLQAHRDEILRKRRHGMGFLGLGSVMTMLRMRYGDPSSLEFTSEVSKRLALVGWEEGILLAQEKGPAPIMEETFVVDSRMLAKRPELAMDGYPEGSKVKGKVLLAHYSRYMSKFPQKMRDEIAAHGCRFTHHTSIAPTGTIALALANNASNGIEPSFAHRYSRNIIREGKKTKEKVEVFSFELLAYRHLINPIADPDLSDGRVEDANQHENRLPDYFQDSTSITPRAHIDVQAAAQTWIDSAISKTINVPTDYPYDLFKEIYLYAYERGLKGCTTFRFNPDTFQGVLVKNDDLASTLYQFTLEDGSVIRLKGDESVEYDGEVHTVANLFDAIKDGSYGV